MPFINTKTTVSLSDAGKDTLTAALGRITRECLGKGENWVMTGYEDNADLSRGAAARPPISKSKALALPPPPAHQK